jgi:hypothetical protein
VKQETAAPTTAAASHEQRFEMGGDRAMYVFDHVGITTLEPQSDEDWVEQSRVWVTNPRNHPEHVEFLRYAPGTTVPEVVRNNPHIAYIGSTRLSLTSRGRKSSFRRSLSAIFCAWSSFENTAPSLNTCSI